MRVLYDYFRSSAAYRVRIALALKELPYQTMPVSLLNHEQRSADYLIKNPQGLVPSLVDNEAALTQSLAICEYLDEVYPKPALLPDDAVGRATVRSLALSIVCDIHPLNNLRVLNYLKEHFNTSEEQKMEWYRHWITEGFSALEKILHNCHGDYCYGNSISLADLCLVPQVYNARRFECDLSAFPTIVAIEQKCLQHEAFSSTSPKDKS